MCVCVSSCDKRKGFEQPPPPHAHLHNGQALGGEEVRGKLIDENLELEEDKQDHH